MSDNMFEVPGDVLRGMATDATEADELLESAWGIIANGGWDGMAPTPGWQDAAVRWRDKYFARDGEPTAFQSEHAKNVAMLGKQVKVTLDHGGYPNTDTPALIVEGTLIGFGDEGTLEILQEDGFIHYCWPRLEMEEVTNGTN